MLKKFFAIELMIIGAVMFLFGIGYGIVNYDCTDYDVGDKIITECVEWDFNQGIGCSITLLGIIIIINGAVLHCDAVYTTDETRSENE